MTLKLKPLNEQVIVITGASSGIGLATAERAVEAGAQVILSARSAETLEQIATRLNEKGPGKACAFPADVAERSQMQALAHHAVSRHGWIDTWINDAGISIYGRLEEVSEEDNRRLFDTNFWGVVNGSLAALPHLKTNGGALINIGSEVSDAAVPTLGMYVASKHAVKGFTDSLRIEIEEIEKAPVSITLIQPTAVNTPFPQHARNYMPQEPKLPTPMINPYKVADTILEAAVKPMREVKVGTMAKVNTFMAKNLPSIGDKMAAKQDKNFRHAMPPKRDPEGALYQGLAAGNVYGDPELAEAM